MKEWMKPTKLEWISFLTMMPLLALFLNILLFGDRLWEEAAPWLYSYPLLFAEGFASWYLHIISMHWLRIYFPLLHQTALRLTILAIIHIGLISATFAVIFYSYDAFHFLGYELNYENFKIALLMGIALTLIATTMWETEYTFKKWKNLLAEKEQLEQLSIQQEFETLKSQVNPHFLFNCFNTLSSLINEDPRQAEVFLNELSKVYRYLLRNNESGLSTLENEVKFVQSYYQLLKTRHGEALHLNIEINKKYEQYLLPSLSLQMLTENVVKHNVLSKNKPLLIDIFTTAGNKLVVNNNLQRRTKKGPSGKVGLENIRSKYELLKHPGFQVLEDEKNYSVVLPLLWSQSLNEQKLVMAERKSLFSEL